MIRTVEMLPSGAVTIARSALSPPPSLSVPDSSAEFSCCVAVITGATVSMRKVRVSGMVARLPAASLPKIASVVAIPSPANI